MNPKVDTDHPPVRRGYRLTERQLGQVLVDRGYITEAALKTAMAQHDRNKERLGRYLVRTGQLQEADLVKSLAEQLGLGVASADSLASAEDAALNLIPETVAREAQALPLKMDGDTLIVALSDPLNVLALDSVRKAAKVPVRQVVASERDVQEGIERYYRERRAAENVSEILGSMETTHVDSEGEVDLEALRAAIDDAPVVRFVNLILAQAIEEGASDIHIESTPDWVQVRYRIDGILHEAHRPPKALQMAIISRIKVLSDLDIAIRLAPQDGRFTVNVPGRQVDCRVSTLPTVFGEKVVLRLFDKGAFERKMANIGIKGEQAKQVDRAIRRAYGMVLLSGPTGSGKSTTLYSMLNEIKTPTRNLVTVEDPVEYHVDGVNQVAANPRVGLSFSSALRSILRQDPDVILVGEIRDLETAEIAVKCALTGHLVLSTIHANDSPSTLTRMVDIGIPRYLVSSAVHMVIAQRLVRRVCTHCAEPRKADPSVLGAFGEIGLKYENHEFLYGRGCVNCRKTGFRGRSGLFEVLEMSQPIRRMMLDASDDHPLRLKALELGMVGLRESGLNKAVDGETTLEEVLNATLSED